MEDLFSTTLMVQNQEIHYRVLFDQEQYIFLSESTIEAYRSFSVYREHDAWMDKGGLPDEIKNQAVNALEKYLMKQH